MTSKTYQKLNASQFDEAAAKFPQLSDRAKVMARAVLVDGQRASQVLTDPNLYGETKKPVSKQMLSSWVRQLYRASADFSPGEQASDGEAVHIFNQLWIAYLRYRSIPLSASVAMQTKNLNEWYEEVENAISCPCIGDFPERANILMQLDHSRGESLLSYPDLSEKFKRTLLLYDNWSILPSAAKKIDLLQQVR